MIDFHRVEEEFRKYVDQFDFTNEKIELKYYHTLEVAKICDDIANRMHLSNEDRDLAKLIGYLHDIGRFEQVKSTNSFKDIKMDHADNGVRLLFEEGMIRKFIDDPKYDKTIEIAIRNHNKYQIIDSVNEREALFAKLIRDADKIDIFRVRKKYYQDQIIEDPSPEVLKYFEKERPIKIKDTKNKTDSILCVIAFIFDFNYDVSLDILKEKKYYTDYLDSILVDPKKREIFHQLKEKGIYRLNHRVGDKEDSYVR